MASDAEYALMSGAAYTSTRSESNRIPWPETAGWTPFWPSGLYAALLDMGFEIEANSILHRRSGFEARVFSNGTETVIAFAGTNPISRDLLTDVTLAAGGYDEQLERAALVYAAVKQASAQPISLTGHSLGGGLAALIGVYFDKTAVTFDQAPFLNAALADHSSVLQGALSRWGFGPDGELSSYYARVTTNGVEIRGTNGVRSLAVEGELLSVAPMPYQLRIGRPTEFFDLDDAAVASTGRIDLHAQSLLILVQHSGTFVERMRDIPTLLPSLFEDRYFDRSTKDPEETAILEHFVRHEFGVPGTAYAAGDSLFTSFVNELTILTEPGVMQRTVLDGQAQPRKQLQHAMMLVLQQHYWGIRGAFDPSQTLFKAASGGWYFDVGAVAGASKVADLLAGRLLVETIGSMYDGGATKFASPALSNFGRLQWQSGEGLFSATGTVQVDLMLGGAAEDILSGAGGDLLLGGRGNGDRLGSQFGTGRRLPAAPGSPPTPARGRERSRRFGWVVYDRTTPDSNGFLSWQERRTRMVSGAHSIGIGQLRPNATPAPSLHPARRGSACRRVSSSPALRQSFKTFTETAR